ncbi:hypothetical protein HN358_03720 [Candidatus Uhrbacteria bacterium]|nr:hypothetical protein [Candidatus Uhrbacteria bacterium]MBT7717672.1 hypothetical protein [Candidatus Uhrbacteria bacterium]
MAGWIHDNEKIDTFLAQLAASSTGECHPDGCTECQNVASRLLMCFDPRDPSDTKYHNEIVGCVLTMKDGEITVHETPGTSVRGYPVIKVFDPTPAAT